MDTTLKDRVLEAVDLVEVIGERVQLKRQGREFVGLCPFHPDSNPSMRVSPQKGIYKCFACGAGGDVIKFVQEIDRTSFREALTQLAQRAGIDVTTSEHDRRRDRARDELRRVMRWARDFYRRQLQSDAGAAARAYAARRGLAAETLERFALGLAPDDWSQLVAAGRRAGVKQDTLIEAGLANTAESGRCYDRFRHRLLFTINDALGRPIAFGGRTLGDDPAKYLNSPETPLFHKSRVMYAFDVTRDAIARARQAIVVEGYMDAVLLHQHGVQHVVATLGTSLTESHVKLLRPLADDIILCFDGDDAGQRAADRGVETALRCGVDVRVLVMPSGVDPADMVVQHGPDALLTLVEQAADALEFKWRQTAEQLGGRPAARRDAIDGFLRFIADARRSTAVDPLEQGLLLGRLSDLTGAPVELIQQALERHASRFRTRGGPTPDAPPNADVDDNGYDAQCAATPEGLTPIVEELLGLVLHAPAVLDLLDDRMHQAIAFCDAWRSAFDAICAAASDDAGLTSQSVINACEDEPALECIRRALRGGAGVPNASEAAVAALHRLDDVLAAVQLRAARELLSDNPETGRDALRLILNSARGRHGTFPLTR